MSNLMSNSRHLKFKNIIKTNLNAARNPGKITKTRANPYPQHRLISELYQSQQPGYKTT